MIGQLKVTLSPSFFLPALQYSFIYISVNVSFISIFQIFTKKSISVWLVTHTSPLSRLVLSLKFYFLFSSVNDLIPRISPPLPSYLVEPFPDLTCSPPYNFVFPFTLFTYVHHSYNVFDFHWWLFNDWSSPKGITLFIVFVPIRNSPQNTNMSYRYFSFLSLTPLRTFWGIVTTLVSTWFVVFPHPRMIHKGSI